MNHLRLNNYHFRVDRQPLAFPPHPHSPFRHTRARRGYLAAPSTKPRPHLPSPTQQLRHPAQNKLRPPAQMSSATPTQTTPPHPRKQLCHTRAQTPSPPRSNSVTPALKLRHPRAQTPSHPRKQLRHTRVNNSATPARASSVIPALAAGISPSTAPSPPLAPSPPRSNSVTPALKLRHPRAQTPSHPRKQLRHTRANNSVIPTHASSVIPAQTAPSYPRLPRVSRRAQHRAPTPPHRPRPNRTTPYK